jgi:pimeloyl-ACP methyl ester carboxylesterase
MALPVGFHRFHEDANICFQLNRLVSEGTDAMFAEVREVARRIHTLDDFAHETAALGNVAEAAGRIDEAARYVRASEFFLPPGDPRKLAAYEHFIRLFNQAHPNLERHDVPSPDGPLPVIRLRGVPLAPTVVVHGGFDSFIEEFVTLLGAMRDTGLDVVAFEGPGQGAMLVRHGVHMTHKWERPTKAVLDHFDLRDVTLVGISLGGYLAIRGAAFEPRVARVVAFDVLDDFFECVLSRRGPAVQHAARALLAAGATGIVDAAVARLREHDGLVRWGMEQGMHVMGVQTPSAFLERARLYRTAPINDLVKQDVLLLAGAEDHFVPLHQLYRQAAALKNARSITTRVFTRAEHAASHCQIGNLPLALKVIRRWIDGTLS